ncbi:MAG: adhesin/invasin [Myxococcota bacterium]|jgi:adhesin/invasin
MLKTPSRSLLAAILLIGTPMLALSAAFPMTAHAQDAVFAEELVELLPGAAAVGDGATSTTLYVLAMGKDGSPLTGFTGKASPTAGNAGKLEEVSPGLYSFSWTPPQVTESTTIAISVRGKTADKVSINNRFEVPVVPPLASAMRVVSNPMQITLGQDTSATLTLNLSGGTNQPLNGTDLIVRSSAGTVSNITHLGGGQFSALYTPPNKPYPHVAVLTFADKRNPGIIFGSFALPLVGKASFPVSSAPNSRVMLRIGDREFGPVQADATGRANVPIVVPPGFNSATLITIVSGQTSEETIDLQLPITQRVELMPSSASVPADPTIAVPVRVFVAEASGGPDTEARVTFTTTAGQVSEARHEGSGVYVTTFTPPYGNASSQVSIQVSVADDRGAQTDSMTLNLVPARPASVALSTEPPSLASNAASVQVFAKVIGQDGIGISGRELSYAVSGARLNGGTRDLGNGDYQTRLTTEGTNAGVELTAVVSGSATANPVSRVLVLPAAAALANQSNGSVNILTLDSYGYPVAGAAVTLKLDGDGTLPTAVTTDANGFARVYYTAGASMGLARISATVGDHTGSAGILQLPANLSAGVSSGLGVLPLSGSTADQAIISAWRSASPAMSVGREGATGAVAATAVETNTVGPIARLVVLSEPGSAAPGGTVTLKIRATDAGGKGVGGLNLDLLTSTGTIGSITDLGDGSYQAPLVLGADASGEAKITVASEDGSVVKLVKIPVTATAAVAAWGTQPTPTETTPTEPVATTTPPVEEVKPPKPPREPREPGDRPWLRLQAGGQGGLYSYQQKSLDANGPIYEKEITFGGGTTSPASSVGMNFRGRGFAPGLTYVGADFAYNLSQYAVALPEFGEPISDWLHDVSLVGVGRYPFDIGGTTLHAGARVGLGLDDFMLYRQTTDGEQIFLQYEPLFITALQVGGEIGAEIGDNFFAVGTIDLGLAGGSSFYRTDLDLMLGYAFTDNLYVHGKAGSISRNTTLLGEDGGTVGELRDGFTSFGLGIGYQM